MDHSHVLNLLLSNACSNESEANPGYSESRIDLHCVAYEIVFRIQPGFTPVYREETNDFEVYPFPYEILEIKRLDK